MSEGIFTRPIVKILAVVAVVAGFVLVVYLMSGLPAPREANRVGPVDGSFSVIHPPDWESQITYSPGDKQNVTEMNIRPIKSVGREEHLFIARRRSAPDFDKLKALGFREGQFQGKPALIYAGKQKYQYLWHVTFKRAGSWYDMALWLSREEDVPHSDWWAYLNSFRASEAPTTLPATSPN